MKHLFFLPLAVATLSATPENPLIPPTWFQEITATDGSTQQCIIFITVPGVEYTFKHSAALEEWTKIGKTTGLIHLQIPGDPLGSGEDAEIRTRAINDNDQILGAGWGNLSNGFAHDNHLATIVSWHTPFAAPQLVSSAAGDITTYADLLSDRHTWHLDNTGSFFSGSLGWNATTPVEPVAPEDTWKKWTLSTGGYPLISTPSIANTKGTAFGGIIWGTEYDPTTGQWTESNITSPDPIVIKVTVL